LHFNQKAVVKPADKQECSRRGGGGKSPNWLLSPTFPMAREGVWKMLVARNNNTSKREAQQTLERKRKHGRVQTCQRMDVITCLLSDQSNAMCIIRELPAMPVSLFVCMKTRQVSWRHSSSFAQGALSRSGLSDGNTFLGTAPNCGLPWKHTRGGQRRARAISHQFPLNTPQQGQKDSMFDCTATACHPNLKPGSTIVALLCGVARTMS
jgi:hypothetical protein